MKADFEHALETVQGFELTLGCANILKEPFQAAEEALEKQIPKHLLKKGTYTRECPRCGTRYGLSTSRSGPDTEYCSRCGQLTSGWNDAIQRHKKE